MSAELPTPRGELHRKTIETLENLTLRLVQGKITPDQFSIAVDAVFSAVSGLVDKSFMDLIHAAGEVEVPPRPYVALLAKGKDVIVMQWQVGADVISVNRWQDSLERGGGSFNYKSASDAKQNFYTRMDALYKMGFVQITDVQL